MPYFTNRGIVPLPSGFTATSTESSNYLARTSGLVDARKTLLDALITGLVGDGVWAKLDALYIFANADSTNALLNLVSSSYTCVSNGSPTFTPDLGFTGADASTTKYLDTQFNANTAGGNFVLNGCHISAWSNTATQSGASGGTIMGVVNGTNNTQLLIAYSDGQTYFQCDSTGNGSYANTNATGMWTANRSNNTQINGYRDSTNVVPTGSDGGTGAIVSGNIYILAQNLVGTGATFGGGRQICSASIGGDLLAGGNFQTPLYSRLRTYMTAVGVP